MSARAERGSSDFCGECCACRCAGRTTGLTRIAPAILYLNWGQKMETYCENNLEAAFEKWSQKSEYVSIEDLECVLADLPKNKRFRTWLPMAATMVQDAIQRGDVDPKKGIKRDAFFALMTHYFKCAKNDKAESQPPTQSSKSPESTHFDMHLDLDAAQKELDDAAGSPRNAETEEVDSSPVPAASNFRVGIVEVFSSDDDEDDGDEEHDQDDLPSIHSTSSAVHHDVHDPSFQAEDLQEVENDGKTECAASHDANPASQDDTVSVESESAGVQCETKSVIGDERIREIEATDAIKKTQASSENMSTEEKLQEEEEGDESKRMMLKVDDAPTKKETTPEEEEEEEEEDNKSFADKSHSSEDTEVGDEIQKISREDEALTESSSSQTGSKEGHKKEEEKEEKTCRKTQKDFPPSTSAMAMLEQGENRALAQEPSNQSSMSAKSTNAQDDSALTKKDHDDHESKKDDNKDEASLKSLTDQLQDVKLRHVEETEKLEIKRDLAPHLRDIEAMQDKQVEQVKDEKKKKKKIPCKTKDRPTEHLIAENRELRTMLAVARLDLSKALEEIEYWRIRAEALQRCLQSD